MDENTIKRTINNIEYSRKYTGKTLEEVAYDLGYETTSRFSNYLYRKKLPNDDELSRIASYFGLTVKQLTEEDYSYLKDEDDIANDYIESGELLEFFIEALGKEFPLVSSEAALLNDDFKIGYEVHNEILKRMADPTYNIQNFYNDFINAYIHYCHAHNANIVEA